MKNNRITLRKSKDYAKFHHHAGQRNIRDPHRKALEADIVENGFLPGQPITVCRSKKPGEFHIIDGHHRFEACKSAGVPFYFVCIGGPELAKDPSTLQRINANQKGWSGGDSLQQHCNLGNKDFLKIQEWMDNYRFTLAQLQHGVGLRGYKKEAFQQGRVSLRSERRVMRIAQLRDAIIAATGTPITQKFVFVVMDLHDTPGVDIQRLLRGLKKTGFTAALDKEVMYQRLEEGYNYRKSKKEPLAFMIKEAARARGKNKAA